MVRQLIEEVLEWQQETFPAGTPAGALAHFAAEVSNEMTGTEELDEMADAFFLLVAYADRMGWDPQELAKWQHIIVQVGWASPYTIVERLRDYALQPVMSPADVQNAMFLLHCYAHTRETYLFDEVEKKLIVNRDRKWPAEADDTGIFSHIKETREDAQLQAVEEVEELGENEIVGWGKETSESSL